jgi:hypothetical protein
VAVGSGVGGVTAFTMQNNTTGSNNTALGSQALQGNTTASSSTAIGYQSAYSNTTGTGLNTFGYQAGYTANTTIDAFGYQTLKLATAAGNAAFGTLALQANTTGGSNTAVGRDSLYSNTTASNNTAVGYQAGYSNTTGANNTLIGEYAGYSLTTGSYNTLIGAVQSGSYGAGHLITTGAKNTVIGSYNGNQGGLDIRTASNYIVLSDGDGNPRAYWNGANSSFAGNLGVTQATTGGYCFTSYAINNGSVYYHAQFNAVGTGAVGSITSSSTLTSYNVSSDRRLKENITPFKTGLKTILALNPSEYNYISDPSQIIQGFVADELQAIVPQAVTGEANAVDKEGNPIYQGVDASFLIPHLVSAIQELKAEIDQLKGVK